ncbi:MAG TPA: hypothetical protein ENN99_14865 [Chloroflexi bacterium]|nr:hypothetical protein [Chloroflexota bacterium]
MRDTYKRAVFVGPRQIRFDELPIPVPGPYQALVRVRACGLCTWEQRSYTGVEAFYPLSSGHEVAGELVALGERVYTDTQIGERVVASMLTRCGYCESCRRGLDNLCDNARRQYQGEGVVGPAGLAEYVLIQDYQLYRAHHEVPFEELCLAEPLACVIHSVRKARVELTDTAVVVGAGVMGLLHLALLKRAGARVIVSEPDPKRAEFARQMGADAVIGSADDFFADQVLELTDGRGADVIFCAVSVGMVVKSSVEAVAKGGRVHVFASVHPRGVGVLVDPNLFHGREITLTGTKGQNKEDMRQAVQLLSHRAIDLGPLISLVLPLERLEEGLQAALRSDTYRVVITP